jgi:hypothetical protein
VIRVNGVKHLVAQTDIFSQAHNRQSDEGILQDFFKSH